MPDLLMPKWEPLTREEEAELAKRMHAGDQAARDRLVLSQHPWLKLIARKYVCPHWPLPDLFQIAILEVLKCLATFDPKKGRLCTYIERPLRWRLHRYVKCDRIIHRPYRPRFLKEFLAAGKVGAMSEDAARLWADGRPSPDELLADVDEREHERGRLQDAISQIKDPRRQQIIRFRLAGHTLEKIGRTLQITREAVRQHEMRALEFIREVLEAA